MCYVLWPLRNSSIRTSLKSPSSFQGITSGKTWSSLVNWSVILPASQPTTIDITHLLLRSEQKERGLIRTTQMGYIPNSTTSWTSANSFISCLLLLDKQIIAVLFSNPGTASSEGQIRCQLFHSANICSLLSVHFKGPDCFILQSLGYPMIHCESRQVIFSVLRGKRETATVNIVSAAK